MELEETANEKGHTGNYSDSGPVKPPTHPPRLVEQAGQHTSAKLASSTSREYEHHRFNE